MYRVGLPGWKIAARYGVPIWIPLQVIHDREAAVNVITSSRLPGLIVEMPETATAEEVHREVNACLDMLMTELLSQPPRAQPVTVWPGVFQAA